MLWDALNFRVALILVILSAAPAWPATITVAAGANLSGNAGAMAAFTRAANLWGMLFSNPITVKINAELTSISDPTVIGDTTPIVLQANYDSIRNQWIANAAAESDDAILSSLPTFAELTVHLPSGFTLSGNLAATKANLKAMGYTGLDAAFGASDATMRFNSNFAFDYDRSDGISPGTVDFESTALHEIGHALGFISVVDRLTTPGAVSISPLDLFRFGIANIPSSALVFTYAARELRPGYEAATSDLLNSWRMATGVSGDGNQASHWKQAYSLGAMNPTLATGQTFTASIADIRAFDLIGWNVQYVPEPQTASLVMFGMAGMLWLRRRG